MTTHRYEFRVGEFLTSEVHFTEGLSWDTRKEMLAGALLFALDFMNRKYAGAGGTIPVEVRQIVRAYDQTLPNASRRSLGEDS